MIYEGNLRHKIGRVCLNNFVIADKCETAVKGQIRIAQDSIAGCKMKFSKVLFKTRFCGNYLNNADWLDWEIASKQK